MAVFQSPDALCCMLLVGQKPTPQFSDHGLPRNRFSDIRRRGPIGKMVNMPKTLTGGSLPVLVTGERGGKVLSHNGLTADACGVRFCN
jgi:hypothetical protein